MPPLDQPASWPLSLGLPVALALAAWILRLVRRSAVLAGAPLGVLVLALGGIGAFAVLVGFFLLGTALTRFGFASKDARGVAEGSGGRRGASHVAANCGMGFLLLLARAVMGPSGLSPEGAGLFWAAYIGSFATAASDTASSEIGQWLGKHPISLRSFRTVPIGTEGAVSMEGLAGGLAAAAVLALLGRALGLVDWCGFAAVVFGGFLGNVIESLAGTWGRKALPHGWLNFTNTAVGAALAAACAHWICM